MISPKKNSGLAVVRNPDWVEAMHWRNRSGANGAKSRAALLEIYLPFAKKLAAEQYFKRTRSSYELSDLEQWAIEATLVSIDRFDPLRGSPFTAYARPRINGHIADGIASMSELGRQSHFYYRSEKERLRSLLESEPEGLSPLDTLRKLATGLALGMMLEGTGACASEGKLELASSGYDSLVWKETLVHIADAIERLPEHQQLIIRQHYQNGLRFSELATMLGVTKGRVSQLHKAALTSMKKYIGKFG